MSTPFPLSDLIRRVGDEHIVLQNLKDGDVSFQDTKRGTRITFYTNQISASQIAADRVAKVGLVVWLPVDRVEQAKRDHAHATAGDDDDPDVEGHERP